ncbi:hypothetical protein E0Z10_g5186 [Xylaria hypoxylon]|uniref:Uncharacterized protein n=1 Tax=Xylaria hypoxylon TaxID=37992 RepID=A0A4Z0Z4M7_9PEZI|nr:hypothetical protein E0Z10_g5186 [Xylaria hypoxylon]
MRPTLKGGIRVLMFVILGLFCFILGLRFRPHATSSNTGSTQDDGAPAIGIDLGSTYSRVAYGKTWNWKEDMHVVPGENGNKTIPSCVAFTEGGPLIGEETPEATICNPGAFLGRRWSDPDVQTRMRDLPYEVTSDTQDRPVFNINVGGDEKAYTPEYVTSLIIRELKHMAEVAMGGNETVTQAVIAVPSYYSDEQKQAVKDAGELAEVEVLRMTKEPIAAALAYGMDTPDTERIIMVFDIGDTLDVSVVDVEDGVFDILASSYHDIGGEHFNQRIISYIVRQWKKTTGIDLAANPSDMRRLNLEVEKAKIVLSSNFKAKVDLSSVNSTLTQTLTRSKFEELAQDLFTEAIEAIRQNLKEAKVKFTEIDDVILTGGSGNIQKIREMIEEIFPGEMVSYDLGSEATVMGAARTGILLSRPEDMLCDLCYFPDFSPLDFGIETADGVMANIAPRSVIPFTTFWNLTTTVDGQSSMLIRVLEGQRVLAANNLVIGEFELPLTPAPAGVPRVEITFNVGDQSLNVSATDLETKKTEYIVVGPSTGMWTDYAQPNGIDNKGAFLGLWPDLHIDPDPKLRAQVDARVDLESYLAALKGRLTNGEEWGTEDIVRYKEPGRPFRLSAVLRDIESTQEDLIKYRDTWELYTLQQLKEDFTILAEPFVGKLEYEVIYKVGGKVEKQHAEL